MALKIGSGINRYLSLAVLQKFRQCWESQMVQSGSGFQVIFSVTSRQKVRPQNLKRADIKTGAD
jgi:hypothetical protein